MATFTPVTRVSGTIQVAIAPRHGTGRVRGTMLIDAALTGAARKNGVTDVRGTIQIDVTSTGTAQLTHSAIGDASFKFWTTLGSGHHGSDPVYQYSEGRSIFEPWTADGNAGLPEGSYAIGSAPMALWAASGVGFTGGIGQGNVSFKLWNSIGAGHQGSDPVYNYSAGNVEFEKLTTEGFDDLLALDLIFSTAKVHARYHIVLPANVITLGSAATALKRVHVVAGSLGTVSNAVKNRIRCHIVAPSEGVVESEATYRGEQGEVWLFNATTYAASRVRGYFFDSLADLDGVIFGASPEGIFELAGTTDNGVPIKSSIIVGRSNSKVPNVKRFSYGYVYGVSAEKLTVRVADETPTVYTYETDAALGSVVSSVRFKVGKGLKMHYWQFAVENQGGTYFELDHVDLLPAVLERWVR